MVELILGAYLPNLGFCCLKISFFFTYFFYVFENICIFYLTIAVRSSPRNRGTSGYYLHHYDPVHVGSDALVARL